MIISVLLMLANISLVITIFFDTSKKTTARRREYDRQQSALALARSSSRGSSGPRFRFTSSGVPGGGGGGGGGGGDYGDYGASASGSGVIEIELTENPMTKQALEEQEQKNKVRTEREFKGAVELFTSQDQLAGVSLNRSTLGRSQTAAPGVMTNVAHVGIGGGAPRGERDGSGVSPNGSVLRRSQTSVPVYKKEAGEAKGGRAGDLSTRELHDFGESCGAGGGGEQVSPTSTRALYTEGARRARASREASFGSVSNPFKPPPTPPTNTTTLTLLQFPYVYVHCSAGCVDAEVEHAAGSSDEEDGTGTAVAVVDVYHNFEV